MKTLTQIDHAMQNGDLDSSLDLLLEIVKSHLFYQPDLRSSALTLVARYRKLKRSRKMGQVGEGEVQITENQIQFALIELLKIVREEVIGREGPHSPFLDYPLPKTRILFFSSNPVGKGQLSIGREIRQIEASLARARLRDRFQFIPAMATRPKDLMQRILEVNPEFVHFSGHGTPNGIHMLNEMDQSVPVPMTGLANVFQLFQGAIGCVLLNACYSQKQAEQIREFIPHVIGTSTKVGDDTAIQFSSLFYNAVGEGNDIPFAFEYAKLGIHLDDLEHDIFIYCK